MVTAVIEEGEEEEEEEEYLCNIKKKQLKKKWMHLVYLSVTRSVIKRSQAWVISGGCTEKAWRPDPRTPGPPDPGQPPLGTHLCPLPTCHGVRHWWITAERLAEKISPLTLYLPLHHPTPPTRTTRCSMIRLDIEESAGFNCTLIHYSPVIPPIPDIRL